MTLKSLLIANRGEIAIRIARAASELGLRTVAVHSDDDARSLHVRVADEALPLGGVGAAAYLDIPRVVALARQAGCDAVHPGYGFLAENAEFARACADAGLVFVGPRPEALELFGDKVRARELAARVGVPLLSGTASPTTLAEAKAFLEGLGPGGAVMVKAVAGGGGRGMRPARNAAELEDAFVRCQSEAKASFGRGDVYVERLIERARHIEIQIIGDHEGGVVHLGERECSIQRRNQKIVEIAPSPTLGEHLRGRLTDAAVALARAARYDSLGTFEFLVDDAASGGDGFAFIEANPRLQVEHTVTEEVTGVDLVKTQLRIAAGATLASLGLTQDRVPAPRGYAIQLRVNMETMDASGEARPSGGTLAAFDVPSGPGIRVDTFGYAGYTTNASFDSLLAKLIAHSPSADYADAVRRAARALGEFRIAGLATNVPFLQALLKHPDFVANRVYTRFVEDNVAALVAPGEPARPRFFEAGEGGTRAAARGSADLAGPPGTEGVGAPMLGKVVSVDVLEGDMVREGAQVAILEAMKMEHIVAAPVSGVVRLVAAKAGDQVLDGQPLLFIEPREVAGEAEEAAGEIDLDAIRPDLGEVRERWRITRDEARPNAVARRRKTNQRTARENVDDLVDPGSFIEYGAFALAAQRRRHPVEKLLEMSPADGLISGIGTVNGGTFGDEGGRCGVIAYDYTVLAGTQGFMNHNKKDRLLKVVEDWRIPLVLFAEGGGGRPGDTDHIGVAGLDVPTFRQYGKLSGLVPLVGIVSGRCFAGNAALLGCSDVVIATRNANIGMGGPAMIEGGGLGVFTPEEVGPVSVQAPSGVIDVLVEDEAEAVAAAKKYLGYFQGPVADWSCADQRLLRRLIPENRLRVYDIREVIRTLADEGSVLELREAFGLGMVTAFIRIEGRPMGLIANNPMHLAGAIDSAAADKAARFLQLCDAFDLPVLSLVDTPGIMVGPEAEKEATVRHASRLFVIEANLSVPVFSVVLRKGYGLGAQAMTGGSFHAPVFNVSWPTGEFGGMGLEGAVRLGYRKELEAVADPVERQKLFEQMVAKSYEIGKAINMAAFLEIDAVIDPFETRTWVMRGLKSMPPKGSRAEKRRYVDTW
jgi:acetyl/propionyl-CoA carboxylase alpha subunit/acetyl-CoA carboxylase carboxyltransferase component